VYAEVVVVSIDHRPLAGVTPPMLLDWFTHLDGTIRYGSAVTDRYLAWHPLNHIRWELARPAPGGGAGEGARLHIAEQFGGRPSTASTSSSGSKSSTKPWADPRGLPALRSDRTL
jgi:hypothetical protein